MPQSQPKSLKELLPVTAMMFAASLLIGMAYNNASPLGLRSAGTGEKSAAPTPQAASASHKGYFNETVAVSLEGAAGAPRGHGAYGNQTVAVGMAPSQTPPPQGDGRFSNVTWLEAKALLRDTRNVLVDARAAAYFEAEHIPGAVSLPATSAAAELSAFAAKYPRTTPLIIYCGSSSCPMSRNLADVLTSQYSYANIRLMYGGFVEYREVEAQAAGGAK